ncbi:HK97 family phage prohead protease [Noviherbaspirillum sp.]|uniref:HK97 family phage prohead protease n=1 Tax=Noviherbaspirillum sp. TaxID=1926288 RepID=UPI0025E0469A|nr:HK97 family phage prohead protease [Noviherbaspirillum sp.]
MTNSFEIRSGGILRAASPGKLTGYAAVFGALSQDLGGFVERILPGAFSKSLAGTDPIVGLFEHDRHKVLGNTRSGTLKLTEDHHGLAFELTLPDVTYARDVGVLVERGDIAGCSFGFSVPAGGDHWEMRDGTLQRDLITVNLSEVTITSNPAYLDTEVAKRSMEAWRFNECINDPLYIDLNRSFWMQTL